jgi:hypothetical protein
VRANRLAARRGLRWVAEAFLIFRVGPVRQLLLNLAFLFAVTILVAVPVLGFAAVWVLFPALAVGPHALARAAAGGALPHPSLLAAGFRRNLPAQLRLGGFFLAAMLVVLAASALADDGRFALAMIGRTRLEIGDLEDPGLRQAMLIGAGLQTVLLGALWYAPLLVAWEGLSATKAAFFSVAASLINWRAFFVYGSALLLLFGFVLLLAMGGALLFGGGAGMQADPAVFAVVWTLLPVGFASSYLGYRDVFGAENPAENPPKSPTIPL